MIVCSDGDGRGGYGAPFSICSNSLSLSFCIRSTVYCVCYTASSACAYSCAGGKSGGRAQTQLLITSSTIYSPLYTYYVPSPSILHRRRPSYGRPSESPHNLLDPSFDVCRLRAVRGRACGM